MTEGWLVYQQQSWGDKPVETNQLAQFPLIAFIGRAGHGGLRAAPVVFVALAGLGDGLRGLLMGARALKLTGPG